ncbi:MAG: FlgD immunoglobulin-like domain containing protein [Candidatus Krumholzibacteriia bacterium]
MASLSGSLFLIMQYPAGYVPPQEGLPLGVGYQNVPHRSAYFVTADGEEWVKVSSGCQVLMEPEFCVRDSSMLAKNQRDDQDEAEDEALPKVLGVSSYPNPFNPVATIQLALPKACECTVRIFDLRGRLVRDFKVGFLEAGYHDLEWWGRDDRGQPASSGVYFAQIRAGDKTLNHRMIMVK